MSVDPFTLITSDANLTDASPEGEKLGFKTKIAIQDEVAALRELTPEELDLAGGGLDWDQF